MQNDLTILQRRRNLLGSGPRLYYQHPFRPVRAEGVYMYEADGTRYLDVYNNVPHVGHCHPRVVEAMCKQAAMLNTNTRYLFDSVLDYAQRLVDTSAPGLDTVFFTCTGSESNDLAARIAKVVTGNTGVLTTQGAYHGNTMFLRAMDGTVNDPPEARASWWQTMSYPDDTPSLTEAESKAKADAYTADMSGAISALAERGHAPAAFFFDTHFCADGIHIPPAGLMQKAVAALRNAGGLVVADEVQPGLGRNGHHFWGYQALGIVPDIVTCGKPMGNGHPIGVVITRSEIAEAFFAADRYFNTFAGNPVSMAAGIAVLDVIRDEGLQANALSVGNVLADGLQELGKTHEVLGELRGRGLLIGMEVVSADGKGTPDSVACSEILNDLCREGVLVGSTGPRRNQRNILKIRPPLVFGQAHVDEFLSRLEKVLDRRRGRTAAG